MQHPKRVFVHRALELEIRLSYYDRILKTLPEPFQDPSTGAMPDQAPGPVYEYEDPGMVAQSFSLLTSPIL
jgi:nuclear cap-binding protein subunit 1